MMFCRLLAIPALVASMKIQSFMVVDPASDEDLYELEEGGVIDLGQLGKHGATIRAIADDDEDIGSVRLTLQGPSGQNKVENTAPWALYGQNKGNFKKGHFKAGDYVLVAKPYALAKARGEQGEELTVRFSVIDGDVEDSGGSTCVPNKVDVTECTGAAIIAQVQQENNNCDFLNDQEDLLDQACHEYLDDLDGLPHAKDLADPSGGVLSFTNRQFWDLKILNEFYDGNTALNTDTDSEGNYLKETAVGIKNVYEYVAQSRKIRWPGIDNFNEDGALQYSEDRNEYDPSPANCDLNAMMCCWVRDRQANDNNGNCADNDCDDADPADNTDVCYHDASRSPASAHVANGIMFFGDDYDEGDSHCHGIAWKDDPYDASYRFAGNNLFYVSFYDHLYQRGYAEPVPGAPMCACLEQMPTVSRSDCTQVDVQEEFSLFFKDGQLREDNPIKRTSLNIDFNACDGATANDLYSELQQVYDNVLPAEYETFLVGPTDNNQDSNCPDDFTDLADILDN